MIFNNGEPWTGEWHVWHENGQKELEQSWKDGQSTGTVIDWYEDGQKKKEQTFKDGKRIGKATVWYANGQKELEHTYKDGKRHGKDTGWHENGQKKFEVTFKDDVAVGKWTEWNEDGSKKKEGNYSDRKLTARWNFALRGLDPENPDDIQIPKISRARVLSDEETEQYYKELEVYALAVPGSVFRNSVWLWRPLWMFVSTECSDIVSEIDIEAGDGISGHCINKTKAKKIATRIRQLDIKGEIEKYAMGNTEFLEALPDEKCELCDGTGIRNDNLGKEIRKKDPSFTCNACSGKGMNEHFAKRYPFDIENVLEFGKFCDLSGGFEILCW
jgi:hypothetical protein